MNSPLQKSDGTAIADLSEPVTNNTDVAPSAQTAVGDVDTVTITFDQPLDSMASVLTSSFSLSGDTERTVTAVDIEGSTTSLTLAPALKEQEQASIMYTKPDSGGVRDMTSNQAESFSLDIDNQTDTAPMPVSGTVEDDTIIIILDQELYEDPRFTPLADDSVVHAHFMLTGTMQTSAKFVSQMKGRTGSER